MASSSSEQNKVIAKYKELQNECNQLATKLTELELERNEHKLVEETLTPLDPDRRAFRLVGGVLVERTVGEVLPSVASNRENLERMVETLNTKLTEKQKEVAEMKSKYNITTQEEAMQQRQRQQQQQQ